MPRSSIVASFATLVLTGILYWSFDLAKHDPVLSKIAPFVDDPYDAIGSFAVIASLIITILALWRTFRLRSDAGARGRVVLAGTQMAVVMAVIIVAVSDLTAMLRHIGQWAGRPAYVELLALVIGTALIALAVGLIVRHALPPHDSGAGNWKTAVAVCTVCLMVLAFYPERLIDSVAGHIVTIVVGELLCFVPMGVLVSAAVPMSPAAADSSQPSGARPIAWAVVLLVGFAVGLLAFLGEMSEGGGRPPVGLVVLLFAIFVGSGMAGIAIAYASLRKPLAL